MKNSYRKKLERAATQLREVYDDLETEASEDFDTYGTRLDDLAGEIEDMLAEDDDRAEAGDDEDADDDE